MPLPSLPDRLAYWAPGSRRARSVRGAALALGAVLAASLSLPALASGSVYWSLGVSPAPGVTVVAGNWPHAPVQVVRPVPGPAPVYGTSYTITYGPAYSASYGLPPAAVSIPAPPVYVSPPVLYAPPRVVYTAPAPPVIVTVPIPVYPGGGPGRGFHDHPSHGYSQGHGQWQGHGHRHPRGPREPGIYGHPH